MSHDRGCFKCNEDQCEYRSCKDPDCPKKSVVEYWDQQERYKKGKGLPKELIVSHHLARQLDFSQKTFGPGPRTEGVLDHIIKELNEIDETGGTDLSEWIDVIILACDGALRMGFTPQQISDAWESKQTINENRKWPDWRTAEPGKAIEHIK